VLEFVGLCLLALFAFAVYAPSCLLVLGLGALAAGRKAATDQ
jgi:hypothetical protein